MRLRLASPTALTRFIDLGPAHGEAHPGRYATVNGLAIGEMLPVMSIGGNVIGHGARRAHKFSIRRENRT